MVVILLSQWQQINPLRLMRRGSRDGVDGVLGLGLRWGLLIPVVDWDKFRQIFLQLGVFVIFLVDDFVVLTAVHVQLLHDLGHPIVVSKGQSSFVLASSHFVHHGVIDGWVPLLTRCLKGG